MPTDYRRRGVHKESTATFEASAKLPEDARWIEAVWTDIRLMCSSVVTARGVLRQRHVQILSGRLLKEPPIALPRIALRRTKDRDFACFHFWCDMGCAFRIAFLCLCRALAVRCGRNGNGNGAGRHKGPPRRGSSSARGMCWGPLRDPLTPVLRDPCMIFCQPYRATPVTCAS